MQGRFYEASAYTCDNLSDAEQYFQQLDSLLLTVTANSLPLSVVAYERQWRSGHASSAEKLTATLRPASLRRRRRRLIIIIGAAASIAILSDIFYHVLFRNCILRNTAQATPAL